MHKHALISEILSQIEDSLTTISNRTKHIQSVNDFLSTEDGAILLDSVCMKLIAIGESVKKIDKLSEKTLFTQYPKVPWKEIMGMRDIISHHYFDIDAETVFRTIKEDIPLLSDTIREIRSSIAFG